MAERGRLARLIGLLLAVPRRLWQYTHLPPVSWLEPGKLAVCAYPRDEAGLAALASDGIRVVINLHHRPHRGAALAAHGMRELHLPVPDYTPPALPQLRTGVGAIVAALDRGEGVVVHCGAGLGRSGTLLACYLVHRGADPSIAIARVRQTRPGSIETPAQEEAVHEYGRHLGEAPEPSPSV